MCNAISGRDNFKLKKAYLGFQICFFFTANFFLFRLLLHYACMNFFTFAKKNDMKRKLLFIAVAFSTTMVAQIPNSGFEAWTNAGGINTPNGWGTLNAMTAPSMTFTAAAGTPGVGSATYLSLTSKSIGAANVNGIAVSGILNTSTMQPVSGFAYTGQPVSMTGKWQHMIFGSSQGSVSVTLTKWNTLTSQRETVASGLQNLSGMAMSWANFTINLNYVMGVAPDSCIIVLKASGASPTDGDYLYVDNLAFSGDISSIILNESLAENITIYPNPAKNDLFVSVTSNTTQNLKIELTNIEGQLMHTELLSTTQGTSIQTINTSNLSPGTYFIKIIGDNAIEIKKIIID